MFGFKNTLPFAYLFLVLIWSYTFYSSVLTPPFFGYFTVDENFITDSGVFLWYGNTPRGLDWPASPGILTAFILFGIHVSLNIVSGLNQPVDLINLFEQFDIQAYKYLTSRENFILILRTIQLVEVGVILVLLLRLLYGKTHTLLTPLSRGIMAFICISAYVVWFNAPVLRPEALAGCLLMYLLAFIVFSDTFTEKACWIVAALFGVILSERLLFIFVSPIVLGAVYFLSERDKLKRSLYSLIITVGVFIVLCPFLISDTLVILKSFVGGILVKMNDKPMATFFNEAYIREYFMSPLSYLIIGLCGLGILKLLSLKKAFYWVVIGNWCFFLIMVLHSAKIYDTHVLPAGVLTVFVSALGVVYLSEKMKKSGIVALLMVLLTVLPGLYSYKQFQERVHAVSSIEMAYDWINTLPAETRLLVLPELEFYLPKTVNCLTRELAQNRDSSKMVRKINYLLGQKEGHSDQNLPLVANSFSFEDEKLYDIQYQLLIKYSRLNKTKEFDYDVYLDTVELASHSVQKEMAIADFKSGKYAYLIADFKLDEIEPIKIFTDNLRTPVYCYKAL